VVPLPGEPQGESITYDRDGVSLLTVSEQATAAQPVVIRYPGPAIAARRSTGTPRGPAAGAAPAPVATGVGAVGLAGLGLAALIAVAVGRGRRRR
jgi:hypothetical protein